MDLSVIIVSWNTRNLLGHCLDSVYSTIEELDFEVIVVDNGSTDGSQDLVTAHFPGAILIRNDSNLGFAAANNQGISVCRGRYVLLLNSDAALLGRAAERMLRYLHNHHDVGIVGGQLLNPDGSYQGSFAGFPNLLGEILLLTNLARLVYPSTYPSPAAEDCRTERIVDWVSGACLMARRTAIEAVGPLDEDFFMYSEETDWCYRMKRAGWVVAFQPEAQAVHAGGSSSHRVPERRRAQIYQSKCVFMRKHYGLLAAVSFGLLVRCVSLVKLAVWLSASLSRDQFRRETARSQVASYRFLLANL